MAGNGDRWNRQHTQILGRLAVKQRVSCRSGTHCCGKGRTNLRSQETSNQRRSYRIAPETLKSSQAAAEERLKAKRRGVLSITRIPEAPRPCFRCYCTTRPARASRNNPANSSWPSCRNLITQSEQEVEDLQDQLFLAKTIKPPWDKQPQPLELSRVVSAKCRLASIYTGLCHWICDPPPLPIPWTVAESAQDRDYIEQSEHADCMVGRGSRCWRCANGAPVGGLGIQSTVGDLQL